MHRVALAVASAAWAAAAAKSDYEKSAAIFERNDDSDSDSCGDDKMKGVYWKHSGCETDHIDHFCLRDTELHRKLGSSKDSSGENVFFSCNCGIPKDTVISSATGQLGLTPYEECLVKQKAAKVLMDVTIQCCKDRKVGDKEEKAAIDKYKHKLVALRTQLVAIDQMKQKEAALEGADTTIQKAKAAHALLAKNWDKTVKDLQDESEKAEENEQDALEKHYHHLLHNIVTQKGFCAAPTCQCGTGQKGLEKSQECLKKGQKEEENKLEKKYKKSLAAKLNNAHTKLNNAKAAVKTAVTATQGSGAGFCGGSNGCAASDYTACLTCSDKKYQDDKLALQQKRNSVTGKCKDEARREYLHSFKNNGGCPKVPLPGANPGHGAVVCANQVGGGVPPICEEEEVRGAVKASAWWPSAVVAAAFGAIAAAWLTARRRSHLPEAQPLLAEQSTV